MLSCEAVYSAFHPSLAGRAFTACAAVTSHNKSKCTDTATPLVSVFLFHLISSSVSAFPSMWLCYCFPSPPVVFIFQLVAVWLSVPEKLPKRLVFVRYSSTNHFVYDFTCLNRDLDLSVSSIWIFSFNFRRDLICTLEIRCTRTVDTCCDALVSSKLRA